MRWTQANAADPRAIELFRRHYSRRPGARAKGTERVAPPGRRVVLLTPEADALYVTSWPRFAMHKWPGAWVCSVFRNESRHLSSDLIVEALAATRELLGAPPAAGIITFVDPANVRRKRDPGRCFIRAGFKVIGETNAAGGHGRPSLIVLGMDADQAPPPAPPLELALTLAI
jgi:hypothetical protein